ncbi:Fe2+-dependent dioxygenase [Psychromonas sp. L1A2]|jgi:PKHD-type hydroxylase|uniref:Fe2+-dependent dioxygenase n=1 Tax=Psychromonas sp. L1A2 TaxID=2686356 RepID=UPI00135ACA0D|nr:Fe2+-dependent dioxygenase [Psychromonas sp. L1A2]
MITILENVLSEDELKQIHQTLSRGTFHAGDETAGWAAKSVKKNLQWYADPELETDLSNTMTTKLVTHPDFATTTYAKKIAPFLFSESKDSGGYGNHVDDALMGADSIIRSDISCTIFLSDPKDYSGGELVFSIGAQALSYKLSAGQAIIYPSTTLHRVEPVTEGVRSVAVTWLESYVRDTEKRGILGDLDLARRNIMTTQGKNSAFDQVSRSHANLLRLWAET